jgi:hypothetical protein
MSKKAKIARGPQQAAKVTISRITRTDGNDEAEQAIWLRVQVGRKRVAEIEMTPEDFALALTGRSEVPATYRGTPSVPKEGPNA